MKEFLKLTPSRFRHRTLFLLPDEITSMEQDPGDANCTLINCSSGERFKVLEDIENVKRQLQTIIKLSSRKF